ncbi:MAG: arginase [Crocinitomicaceae bacterium]
MKEIKIIENSSEIGAGTRGASLGIGALKVAARKKADTFFGKFERFIVSDQNDMLDEPTEYVFARRIDGLSSVYRNTVDIMTHVYNEGDFPLVISGDHACAAGTIAGIKKAHPEKRLGVIWIDAHADLHTPYTTPSGNMHGMPLAVALGADNLESRKNEPDERAVDMWEDLKEIGGVKQKLNTEDLVFISVRDTEQPEDEFIARNRIKNYTVNEVRAKGTHGVVEEIKSKLAECDLVYISFDVDSMDCDLVSMGTGTPVPDGLTPEEANAFLTAFAKWPKTTCVEFVEINPCLDNKTNRMAEVAYDILKSTAAAIEKNLE